MRALEVERAGVRAQAFRSVRRNDDAPVAQAHPGERVVADHSDRSRPELQALLDGGVFELYERAGMLAHRCARSGRVEHERHAQPQSRQDGALHQASPGHALAITTRSRAFHDHREDDETEAQAPEKRDPHGARL